MMGVDCVFRFSSRGRALGSKKCVLIVPFVVLELSVSIRKRTWNEFEGCSSASAGPSKSGGLSAESCKLQRLLVSTHIIASNVISLNIPKSLSWALPAMHFDLSHRTSTPLHSPDAAEHLIPKLADDSSGTSSPDSAEVGPSDMEDFDDPLISLLSIARERYRARETASNASSSQFFTPRCDGLDSQEAALLDKWKASDIERILLRQVSYSSPGIHDCKRDVGPGLDAVQAGIIAEECVPTLFDA